MRYYLGVLFVVLVFIVPWFSMNYPGELLSFFKTIENVENQVTAVILSHNPKTVTQIKARYDTALASPSVGAKKVKILLVPGHEPDFGGAEFGNLKEREMTVQLAQQLREFLLLNPRYEVTMTRNTASWNVIFSDYFNSQTEDIAAWLKAHKEQMTKMTQLGLYKPVEAPVMHNKAPNDVALRLYGISKWVNENDYDIAIHIHFNDYPGHGKNAGEYNGITIYVPQEEYSNSSTTKALADTIFKRLSKYNAISNLSGESAGVVPDPDLIAVGALNSVDAASMLIEYGYIYEPQFTNPKLRDISIQDLAFQTYLGLQDFFDPKNTDTFSGPAESLVIPGKWANANLKDSTQVFALQTALLLDGVYPPDEKSLNDCPRSGMFGACTKAALDIFQKKHGITGEKGIAGEKTLEQLNKKYTRQEK